MTTASSTTHISAIRAIDRDPTCRRVTLALDDGTQAHQSYRQAAQLGFWLKPGQYIEKARHFSGTGLLFLTLNSPSTHQ